MRELATEDSKRQAEVNIGGATFETHVKNILNSNAGLIQNNIRVLDRNEVWGDQNLKSLFSIPIRYTGNNISDIFLVVQNLETQKPIVLISCSMSLHGRFPLTLFYSLLYKQKMSDLKVVFVTPDKGAKKKGSDNVRHSEWGSHNEPTKPRALAEKYLDGVYIDSAYLENVCKFTCDTKIEGALKTFPELIMDLINWKNVGSAKTG